MNELKITRPELAKMLKDPKTYNGCTFIGIDLLTQVKLTGGKGNDMQGRVTKLHSGYVAMLFSNKVQSAYGSMVNRRKERDGQDGDFVPSKLTWGERTPETAHIFHTNKDGVYADYVQLIYVQHAVSLMKVAEDMGVQTTDADVEFVQYMNEKIVAYNTPNGNIEYLLDGKAIAKEKIEGLPSKSSEGKQGGLNDLMKVIVRTPKLESITRITMGGTKYIIED